MRLVLTLVEIVIYSAQLLIAVRAVVTILPVGLPAGLVAFIYRATEPVLAPVRRLVRKVRVLRALPVDIAPLVAFIILAVVGFVLSRVGRLL
ncbi:YggT family protein [Oscillospiraceae bacterium OttesenSCG-928-F05]|nr:YggT family protein [Oscillospiraceae bacterium OttesenSCG-928-F05]